MVQHEKRCRGCMSSLSDGRDKCGVCGYPANAGNGESYLRADYILSERYLVGRVMKYSGDAAIYLGYDLVLKSKISIREFFPNALCERADDQSLRVMPGCQSAFVDYADKFRRHARSLARLRELSAIDAMYDIFDTGNTAYSVSEYCDGSTLENHLSLAGGHMKWDEARPLFMPLLSNIASLHSVDAFHFGISPTTIIVTSAGKLHLQGFCMADVRQVGGVLAPELIPHYSAPEQYNLEGKLTAATDVYGLAATMFRALTGNPPPDGSRRAKDCSDLLVPADVAAALPDYVAAALFQSLQSDQTKRPESVEIFHDKLSTAPAVSAMRQDDYSKAAPAAAEKPRKKRGQGKMIALATGGALLVLLILVFVLMYNVAPGLFGIERPTETSAATGTASTVETTAATIGETTLPTGTQYAVTSVVGKIYEDIRKSNLTGGMKLTAQHWAYSDTVPKGSIISQTPDAESFAEHGTEINVVISLGSERVEVPGDLAGWQSRHAERYLTALGFKVEIVLVHSDIMGKGLVVGVEQGGQRLAIGSVVGLRVSDTEHFSYEDVPPVE